MNIQLSVNRDLNATDILQLYQANKWSAADKPELLIKALFLKFAFLSYGMGWYDIGRSRKCYFRWIPRGLLSTSTGATLLSRQRCWAFDYG